MFKQDLIYIKMNKSKAILLNLINNESIEINSAGLFDHPRSIIYDFKKTSQALKMAFKKIQKNTMLRPKVLVHWYEHLEVKFSDIEKTALLELTHGIGANVTCLVQSSNEISNNKLIELFKFNKSRTVHYL